MGMSASQARFLCLTARKNNVEFEGQQINQQRTCLSNESASYYSELCNMAVPVPPSVDDYTKVTYTFNDGAMKNTITSLLFYKEENATTGTYHVSYLQQWQDDYAITPASSSLVMKDGNTYSVGGVNLRLMDASKTTPDATDKADPYFKTLTEEQQKEALETEKYLLNLLKNYAGEDTYYVRYVKNENTGAYEPVFYSGDKLQNTPYNERNLASVPAYNIGSQVSTREVLNKTCEVEQDGSGRYVAITITETTGQGQNATTSTKTYQLDATTVTDEAAYNDAMNDYFYQQHEYEHKIQEINSKLEIIQQQDKQLELKLKQLDTEENAISTEMDAVKKVISKNVDSSFKTFSA